MLGISFVVLLMIGVPIAFVLGLTSLVYILASGTISLHMVPLKMYGGEVGSAKGRGKGRDGVQRWAIPPCLDRRREKILPGKPESKRRES